MNSFSPSTEYYCLHHSHSPTENSSMMTKIVIAMTESTAQPALQTGQHRRCSLYDLFAGLYGWSITVTIVVIMLMLMRGRGSSHF